jgi:hypothetical protein
MKKFKDPETLLIPSLILSFEIFLENGFTFKGKPEFGRVKLLALTLLLHK